MNSKTLLLGVVFIVLGLGAWRLSAGGGGKALADRSAALGGAESQKAELQGLEGDSELALAPEENAERVEVQGVQGTEEVLGAKKLASLNVLVQWSDETPAAGIGLVLSLPRIGGMRENRLLGESDEEGRARFVELGAGEYVLNSDRSEKYTDTKLTIEEGAEQELTLTLAEGVDVVGTVRDREERPVAGAEIWLTMRRGGWTGGRVVTRADAAGAFAIRSAPKGQSVGAIARDYLPSVLVDLDLRDTEQDPARVELILLAGGASLKGTVTDAEGEPVAGAQILLGDNESHQDWRNDSSIVETWAPRMALSDAQGLYFMSGLKPGKAWLRVRAMGFAMQAEEITLIGGETLQHPIVMLAPTTVFGIARDLEGKPVEGAVIHGMERALQENFLQSGQVDYEGSFPHLVTVTDAGGRYRLEPMHAGQLFLYAQEFKPTGAERQVVLYQRHQAKLQPGQELEWNPVFGPGRSIEGSIRFRDGNPVKDVFISATPVPNVDGGRRAVRTTDGNFQFIQLTEETYELKVQLWEKPEGFPDPVAENIKPGGPPVDIVVDLDSKVDQVPAKVIVRFEDRAKRAPSLDKVSVVLKTVGQGSWRTTRLEDGVAEFELDEPGTYQPSVIYRDRVIAVGAEFPVAQGAQVDLGTLISGPGGSLKLTLNMPAGFVPDGAKFTLEPENGGLFERGAIGLGKEMVLDNLEPGPLKVSIWGGQLSEH